MGATLLHKITQRNGHTSSIFECIMLMNGKLCVIFVLLQFIKFDGSKVDYVGTTKEILEVDFRSLVLKVGWFHNMA